MPRGILHGFSETLAALHESHAEGDSGAPHRILQTSSARRASELTAFWAGHELKGDDITPANRGWQGQYPEEDNPDYDDDSITIEFPKPRTTPSPQWLGIVEDPETLASTDIGDEEWIGHPQPTRKHLKPGEFPQCEPFLTGKYSPWWHPSFEMKMPVHAVRVRLTDLNNHVPPSKRKPIWDVIFAGRPGGAFSIVNDAVPAGGKHPQFPPFCPPLKATAKYELRLTEAQNEQFDEKLTLMPKAALAKERLKWLRNSKKPHLPMTTKKWTDGAVTDDVPEQETEGDDVIKKTEYMSMPPLLMTLALSSFL
jgi:hypothetical protein|mmetsp:Transcript_28178/g.44079  ORF Transcript_28178/g.44079 Transcript_28178/m.44079 type:complete len:310 (-) Transcript_28178:7-936(-)